MKTNEDFYLIDKAISKKIMSEQVGTWTEQCQSCYGTGHRDNLQCVNCNGEGFIEYK